MRARIEQLAFELRPLINVPGRERRILGRRNLRHVAVHTDGAAMDKASGMPLLDGIGDMTRALDVDVAIVAVGMLRLAVDSRNVIDDVAVLRRAPNGRRIGEISG